MIIYVDVLIFVNLLINYSILSATQKFLHLNTNQFRLFISSLVGAIASLVVFLPIFSTLLSYATKLLLSIIMCIIAFTLNNKALIIKTVLSCFVISVILSGVFILIYQTVKPNNMAIINDTVYLDINPLILILITFVAYLAILLLQRIFSDNISETIANLEFDIKGNTYVCRGKIDTGCTVVEPFSGDPVIVVEESVLGKDKIQCNRLIPFKALDNNGIIKAIKADKVLINNKKSEKNIYIGIYNGDIDSEFKAIINYKITR